MSIANGVRAAAAAYHEETGRHIDMIVIPDYDKYLLDTELQVAIPGPIEIDGVLVTIRWDVDR